MQAQCEELLKKALVTLTSLDRLKAHRTQLMKALNGGLGKQLLHPFLPHAFVDGHLGEVFARAEGYLESRMDSRVLEAHRTLADALTLARRALFTFGTN